MTSTLDAPLYDASPVQAVARYYRKYATFFGRASRSEYWWVALFNFVVLVVLAVAANLMAASSGGDPATSIPPAAVPVVILLGLFLLVGIVPGIALTVRRLHDGNLSGWLVLLALIPSVGSLIVMVLAILPSSPEGARFDR